MWQTISIFVRADSPIAFDGNIEKLSGLRVGVINKVSLGKNLDNMFDAETFPLVEIASNSENLVQLLVHGRVDFILVHRIEAIGIAHVFGVESQIGELQPSLDKVPAYIAMTKACEELSVLEQIDAALVEMRTDGTYNRICDRHTVLR